jgi:SPW repeat-containing protein
MDQQTKAPNGMIVLLSLWLILSPFVLSFAGSTGMWNAVIVGAAALLLGWLRFNNPYDAPMLSWVVVLLGLWLILSPFVFGMSGVTTLLWDYILVGLGYILFGAWSAMSTPSPLLR